MVNLIFCFDGTCNSPDSFDDYLEDTSITNVLKLHAMFGGSLDPKDQNDSNTQRSFYYSGIGTYGNKIMKFINKTIAPKQGDMHDILKEAHDDLDCALKGLKNKSNKDVQPQIFIFGFSRGAAIARIFAAELDKKGRKVKFLGVFDTVAATRGSLDLNPDSYPASGVLFEDGNIGEHIEKAVHLIALDEKRIPFQPTLFNQQENITEVWFAGVHSDIGGGYWFDGLSDIALQFMIDQLKDTDISISKSCEIDYNLLKTKNTLDSICEDDVVIKDLSYGKIHLQNLDNAIDKKLLTARTPRVNKNDTPDKNKYPTLHHSVVDRFNKVANYRPFALRNLKYCIMREDGSLSKPRVGISQLGKPLD